MTRSRDDEIRAVIKEEGRRGSRQPHSDHARKEHEKRLRQARKLLERATEEEVVAAIRAAGLRDGSPEALEALRVWRENRS
jgi:hypothetical protein